jgi:DNA-binding NarL/FixJ family response regulator
VAVAYAVHGRVDLGEFDRCSHESSEANCEDCNGVIDSGSCAVLRAVDRGESERMKSKDLSSREREVMEIFAEGKSAKMVGERLGISKYTVQTHALRIKRKMESANLAQACYRFALWRRSSEMHAIEQNERKQINENESEMQC